MQQQVSLESPVTGSYGHGNPPPYPGNRCG